MIITDYKKADKPGVLIGSFTIHYETPFGPRWESDLKLFMKNGHRWIAFPSKSIKESDGKYSYQPLSGFEFGPDFAKFTKTVLDALDRFCANGGQIRPIDVNSVNQSLPYKDD
jgi:hypothetical protein